MKSLQLNKPHLLVVVGVPGAGKSTFAAQFAQTFNAPFVDYAQLRQLIGDVDLAYKVADHLFDQLIRTKQTIVIDGPGDKAADRRDIVRLARKSGYTPLFVWVQTEPNAAEQRAVHSKTASMTKSEFDARFADFEPLTAIEPMLVISGKHTYASQARNVLKKLITERTSVTESKVEIPPSRTIPVRGHTIR